jgi:peptide/nickel transport system substrate-binding protein/oligopeptide transport system substrate-binding protein
MSKRIVRQRRVCLMALLSALALLVVLLAGCSLPWQQQSQPSDLAQDQTLRMVWNLPFATLDPAAPNQAAGLQMESLLFDTLVTAAPDGQVEPWGADSWTISPDGLTYTFHIRPRQRFSDGTVVKPSDYARAIDRIANPCAQAAYGYLLAPVKDDAAFNAESCNDKYPDGAIQTLVGDSIVADDSADTLTFMLARPAGYFLAALTHSAFSAIERSLIPTPTGGLYSAWTKHLSDGKTGQGGSGMFYLAAQSDTLLTLKPNPFWWGRHAGKTPHFTEVDVGLGKSPSDDFSAFMGDGALAFSDGVADVSHVSLADARMQPYYHEQPLLAVTALQFDWRNPPFDDLNARKAFCLAINRDQINQQVYHGAMIPT